MKGTFLITDKNKIIKKTKESSQKQVTKSQDSNSGGVFSSLVKYKKDNYNYALSSQKNNPLPKLLLVKQARLRMTNKYNASKEDYATNTLDNLIYNKNCHIVSVFKESMIMDYLEEFLKR